MQFYDYNHETFFHVKLNKRNLKADVMPCSNDSGGTGFVTLACPYTTPVYNMCAKMF